MANRIRKDAGTAWLEKTNPLRGLSIREAQMIFDAARNGDTQRLHWIFQEIESANPVLLTCVERRASAISGIDYGVNVLPAADQTLGDEQKDAVEQFLAGIENFSDMVEHLDLAFFRGFSYAQPLWEADGTVRRVELLDSWQFLTNDGRLYFNPVCDGFTSNAVEVTREAGLIGLKRRRPIDYPALSIHIREAVGERDWGRFLERIALPKPAITMAPNATDKDRAGYVTAAEEVEDGKSSVWPNGTGITDFMGGSRGQDPFSGFIRHQEEKIVLLSTGGTLTSLAQADTGTLAGGAQMEVWREIVAKDAVQIEAAVKRALVRPFLEQKFPGRPVAVDFAFDRAKKLTAKESAEVAATLKNAGYLVNQSELEEAVGFSLVKDDSVPPSVPAGGAGQPLGFAKAKTVPRPSAVSLRSAVHAPGRTAERSDAAEGRADKTSSSPLAKALQDAFESAIGEAMAEELTGKREEQAKAKKDAKGNEHDEGNGQFTSQGGNGSENVSKTKLMQRQRSCQEALRAYKASTDHPSVEDVVSGKVDIRDALKKGFEATFGGQKVVFFTQEKIGDKYDGRGEHGRISMIKHVLAVRSNMFPVRHHGEQTGLVERLTSKNSNQRHVVTIDSATGIAVNVMRCSDAYIRRNYKK